MPSLTQSRAFQPSLEVLEDRLVMDGSSTTTVISHTVTVEGDTTITTTVTETVTYFGMEEILSQLPAGASLTPPAGDVQSCLTPPKSPIEFVPLGPELTPNALAEIQRQVGFQQDLRDVANQLQAQGVFVANPNEESNVLYDGLTRIAQTAVGTVLGGTGWTCGDFVNQDIKNQVQEALTSNFGSGATVETHVFWERSSEAPYIDIDDDVATVLGRSIDYWNPDNHILFRATLPDGTMQAIDFWENSRSGAPIVRPWDAAVEQWREAIGAEEFREGSEAEAPE